MADRHQPPTYTCSHLCYSPFPPPPPEPLLQSILSLLLRHYPTPSPESAYSSLLQRIDLLESSFHRFSSPPCPDSAISLRDLAARRIQARFRAFLVRRSRGFRRLKEIVSVKCSLDDLKSSILPHNRLDSVSVSRGAVCLISRLEIIQAGDKVTRDSKSLVLRDIAEFVEQVEGICGGRNEALSREMKNKWNVDNDEKRLIDSLRERLERIPEMSEVGESEDECIGVEKLKMLLSNVEKRVRFLEDENATRVCNGSRLSGNVKMIEDAVEKHDEDSARSVGGNGDKEEPEKEVCEDEVETENEGCEDKDEAENAVSEDEDGTETTRVCNGSRLSGNVKMIEDAVEKHEDSARSVGGNGDEEEPEKEVCEDEVETENEGCEGKDEAENAVSEDEDGTETTRVCNGSRLSGNVKMVEDAVEKHEDSARSVGGNGDEEEPEKEVCEDEVQTENEGSGDDWETENEACEHEYETEDEGSEVEVESENEVCEHEFETEDEGSEDCDETETEDYDDNDEDETEEEEGSEAEGESKNGIPEGNNHHGYIDDGRGNGYHGRFMRNVICHNCNTRGKVFLSHPNTNNIMAEQGGGERRLKGSVKWFDDTKGFGFITPNEGGDDLFVHHSFIRTDTDGFRSLDDGEEVEFVIEKGDDGRTKAVDVTGLNGAPIQGSRRGGVRGNCFSCGEPGHIARECPIGISSGHGHMSRCCPNNNR